MNVRIGAHESQQAPFSQIMTGELVELYTVGNSLSFQKLHFKPGTFHTQIPFVARISLIEDK